MQKLYKFQEEGVEFMLKRKHSLLADDMGLGKSVQAVECFNRLDARKILIICLHSAKYQWKDFIWKWANRIYDIQIIDTRKDAIRKEADIIILN